jgi:hypothetical protein
MKDRELDLPPPPISTFQLTSKQVNEKKSPNSYFEEGGLLNVLLHQNFSS